MDHIWQRCCQRAETIAKPELMAKKILPCILWDLKGIINCELLEDGQTFDSDFYYQQLDRLKIAIG